MAYFKDHELIGGFKITRSLECKLSQKLPIFIPENIELREDLSDGFDVALKINDYEARKEPKQRFFLEWLINNFHRGVVEKTFKRPSFICYGGRITEPLSTKAFWHRDTKWEIYAAKFNDSIYLWREDYYNSNKGKQFLKPSPYYYNSRFRHLLTTMDVNDSVVNEFEKLHSIHQVSFDTHQILCLNVFEDAKTMNDELMSFKTYMPHELQKKRPNGELGEPWVQNYGFHKSLRVWAQCMVGGIPNVVLGERLEKSSVLNDVNIVAVDDFATSWNLPVSRMYDFLDRILTRINSELEENDPKMIKKFTWAEAEGNLTVEEVDENDAPPTMLPDWYITSVEEQVAAT